MKKIIIYLATMLLAAMTFTGCYDLETYPGDKVNEGTFYKTGDHAHQGLMGIYGMLRLRHTVPSSASIIWEISLTGITII